MKKFLRSAAAAALCAVMLVSGCSSGGKEFAYADGYQRVSKTVTASIVKSTDAGNSGSVTLQSGDTYAVIKIKDYGDITVKLYPDEVPYAVQNFIDLAQNGTYDGRNFHRIIEDFMAQGGSASGDGTGGDSYEGGSFRNEINTSLRHYYGALCYASAMGSISDQFYIVNNKKEQTDLENLYAYYAAYYSSAVDAYAGERDKYDEGSSEYNFYNTYVTFYKDSADGAQAMLDTCTDEVGESYKNGGTPSLDGGYTVFGQTVEGFDVIDKITAVEKTTGGDNAQSKPVTDIIIDSVKIYTKS